MLSVDQHPCALGCVMLISEQPGDAVKYHRRCHTDQAVLTGLENRGTAGTCMTLHEQAQML